MKKVLLASTALMLTAGYAAAEVSVSGSANFGVTYLEDRVLGGEDSEMQLHYELDFGISGSGTTDSGLEFGASLDFDLDDSDTGLTDDLSDPEVFISGAFGTLTVGAVDSASDNVGLGFADVGFDGIGVDDDAETFIGAGDANILYTGSFGDLTVAVSASADDSDTLASDDFAIGVAYAFGDYEVQAAWEDASDEEIIYLGFEGSAGSISYDLFYHQNDDADVAGYGASVSFESGALTYTIAAGATDIDGEDTDFGIGVEYDLGGGATLAGGLGTVDDALAADFGINMSF